MISIDETKLREVLEIMETIGLMYLPRIQPTHFVHARETLSSMLEQKPVEPIATLHDDGYWTWKGTPPYKSSFAGWRMDVFATPQEPQT